MGQGDQLNFRRDWTIGSTIELYNTTTQQRQTVPAAGQMITVLAAYVDSTNLGIIALDSSPSTIQIQ
jgi:hypothetical protein